MRMLYRYIFIAITGSFASVTGANVFEYALKVHQIARLPCRLPIGSHTDVNVRWFSKNNGWLTSGTNVYKHRGRIRVYKPAPNEWNLLINNVNKELEDTYTCKTEEGVVINIVKLIIENFAECDHGKWGENCKRRCFTCHNETCNKINGSCYSQCKPGFKQTEFCDQECSSGWYGFNCSEECSLGCNDATFCRKTDGSCIKCKSGFEGKQCDKEMQYVKSYEQTENIIHMSVGGIAAIVVTCIVLIFFSVLVSVFITRKKLHRNQNRLENETVTCSNVLVSEGRSAVMNTQESNVEMENTYDGLKRTSGIEHIYE